MTSSQARQKILFFVSEDWFFCSHFFERAVAARNAGFDIVILTHVNRHAIEIENSGFRLIRLDFDRGSMNPLSAFRTLMQIVRIYRKERPALVHQVALKPILLGSIAARLSGSLCVVNAVVGGGYAFISEKMSMYVLRQFLLLLMWMLLNPRNSKVVFENSDDLLSFVQRGLVKGKDAVLIKGAGIDTELYQESTGRSSPSIIVLVARLLWDKGVGEFVEAARLLSRRGVQARFVIVGDADPANRASIDETTLESWRKEGIVELWGFRTDMTQVLAQASIACLPSYREGLPKSLLEAMAAGLPCVTTNVPGCREAVSDGDNGLLVPPRNPIALASALERLLTDMELAIHMGRRGRYRAETEFSSALIGRQTVRLYEEMLGA